MLKRSQKLRNIIQAYVRIIDIDIISINLILIYIHMIGTNSSRIRKHNDCDIYSSNRRLISKIKELFAIICCEEYHLYRENFICLSPYLPLFV